MNEETGGVDVGRTGWRNIMGLITIHRTVATVFLSFSADYRILRNKLRNQFIPPLFESDVRLAEQIRSANVSHAKHNAHWRGACPLF